MPSSLPLDRQPFVVLDFETTGGSALFDRVIEVAALRVRDGVVEERLDTLVDPCCGVPPFITRLTGITPTMLRGRPRMDALLPKLQELTRDAVLVAHNASFDYAFLEAAFRRAGIDWRAERLCTLRLARRLLPGLPSYKLDSLCAYLGLAYVQRHRAGPDAEATAALLAHLLATAGDAGIATLTQLLTFQLQPVSSKRRKGKVDEAQVASLPTGPGVYLLKDDKGHVVYVGKSVNVRQRVRTHLRPSGTSAQTGQPRLRKRLPYIADVEAIETNSELEALTLESKLVKRYLPEANRQLRDSRDYPFLKLDLQDPYPRLTATRERPGADGAAYFGPFRKTSTVVGAALFLTEQLGLRQCKEPITAGMSACALLDLGKCAGPCVGAVTAAEYRARVDEAQRLLSGDDRAVLDRAAARRDALSEQLRFEQAAELRDRIRDVEQLIGAQERIRSVAERNLVIVLPEASGGAARLFLVRGGRLARELSVTLPAHPATLRSALRTVYASVPQGQIERDEVDEMLILDAWLRHRRDRYQEVPVAPEAPESALPALRQALAGLIAVTPPAA